MTTNPNTNRPEEVTEMDTTTKRPVKGWRNQHRDWDIDDDFIVRPFAGKWDYEPGCGCAKCENFWNSLAACVGDFPEEG